MRLKPMIWPARWSPPAWRLVCKTLPEVLSQLTALLRKQHGYEVPQITMRTELCLSDYAQWLKQQLQPE